MTTPIQHALIVGCPRSGTTLLQSMLAAHPEVFSAPETHFFCDAVGQRSERMFGLPPRGWRERERRRLHRARVRLGLTQPHLCRRRLVNFVSDCGGNDLVERVPRFPLFLRPAARLYAELGDELARRRDKRLWLEKTPGHLHYLDTIERYFPDLRVVCMVRSAPDNIASMYDVAMRYPHRWRSEYRTVQGCVGRWLEAAQAAEAQAGRSDRLFIAYEDLVKHPARSLGRVCAFLGLAFEPSMIERREATYGAIVRAHEVHKANIRDNISSRNGTKFSRLFVPRQQEQILSALGDWPERLAALCAGQAATLSTVPSAPVVGVP